ncbi:MAG: DUF4956 domain-containing protein [Thermoanaerobaculia bacterium]|jgi:hypothetical protein|nr:MAG: DUF4956 domain-containing protein [Thermoanaerobaculia bacterium]MBZ0101227.1 DUF4956 domain-containing protein [Thermoanaerobaculia bacterium]
MNPILKFLEPFGSFSSGDQRDVALGTFAVLLVASLLSSLVVTLLYRRFHGSRETGSEIYLAFPLLGLATTAIFLTIQFSLPLSLGLLGALSIVRFRTPIKAPEEIGFILFLVAGSLACATFNLRLLALILAVGWLALIVRRWVPAFGGAGARPAGSAVIGIATELHAARGDELLELARSSLASCELESLTRSEGSVAVTLRFRDREERAAAFARAVAERFEVIRLSVVFDRPGAW